MHARRIATVFALALMLVGCGRRFQPHYAVQADTATQVELYKAPGSPPVSGSRTPSAEVGPSAPMLAYTYSYGLESAAGRLAGLMRTHEQACRAAGLAVCQITSSSLDRVGDNSLSGKLQLRATPAWLQTFRDGLAKQAADAGGRITRSGVESEDLTRQIVDTDAGLRAKTLLQTRLEDLLRTRPGKLSDLVALEEALSKVQGDIDATRSELAVMRTRVDTSALTIDYSSEGLAAGASTWRPLNEALKGSLGALIQSIAALIWTVAFATPLVLFIGLIAWIARRFHRRRPRRRGTATGIGADPPLSHPAPPPSGA